MRLASSNRSAFARISGEGNVFTTGTIIIRVSLLFTLHSLTCLSIGTPSPEVGNF